MRKIKSLHKEGILSRVPEYLPLLLNSSFVLKNKASKSPTLFAYITPDPNLVGKKKVRKENI